MPDPAAHAVAVGVTVRISGALRVAVGDPGAVAFELALARRRYRTARTALIVTFALTLTTLAVLIDALSAYHSGTSVVNGGLK